jgi:iron(III) transport system substrate-binding protein
MIKRFASIVLVLALLASSMGCAQQAAKPTHLTVLGTPTEEYVDIVCKAFEKKTGIKTEWVRLSSGEALARIRAEKDKPTFSVWWGGPADGQIAAKGEGLLEKYVPASASKIPSYYKDAEGYWHGIYVGALAFGSNTKWLEEHNVEAPKSWADLLKPEFKGQISMAHPSTSGTAYTMLATILQVMGEDAGWEYLKKFNGQIYHYTKAGAGPLGILQTGEVGVGVVFGHDLVTSVEAGYPVQITFPSEGTGYEIGAVALIKGAPEAAAAKMFIDFALTAECQNLGKQAKAYQFLTAPDATPPSQVPYKIADLKVVNYNFEWAGKNRTAFTEKFTKEIEPNIPTK